MLSRYIGNVDRPAAQASCGSMIICKLVHSLKHVPIRNHVQILCKNAIMRVGPYMPAMGRRNLRKVIVRISCNHSRSDLWHEGVEECLGKLRHARDSRRSKMSQRCNGPLVEIRIDQLFPSRCAPYRVEHALRVCLDAVYARLYQKRIKVVVELRYIVIVNHRHVCTIILSFDLDSFIFLCNFPAWGDAAPIAQQSMPNENVLNVSVAAFNLGNGASQTTGKSTRVRFKFEPARFVVACLVDGLPVVIDDQIRDADSVFLQLCKSIKNFIFCKILSERVPST